MKDATQYTMDSQGNIVPCPYREKCKTYQVGCGGLRGWCYNAHKGRANNPKEEQDNE